MIRAIIIDDESHCRTSLQAQLMKLGNTEVVASCSNVEDAKKSIYEFKPDLIFLDVELSDSTGFELLKSLDHHEYDVIFTTAYDQYALQAIKASALDYILKPISMDELEHAVNKHLKMKSNSPIYKQVQVLLENYQRSSQFNSIALPMQEGIEFVSMNDIVRLESESNYTIFYLINKRKITVSRTLKEYEGILSSNGFVRIHNSHIINLQYLEKYFKGDGGYVKMKDGSTADVSRQRKEEFMKILGKI